MSQHATEATWSGRRGAEGGLDGGGGREPYNTKLTKDNLHSKRQTIKQQKYGNHYVIFQVIHIVLQYMLQKEKRLSGTKHVPYRVNQFQ